MVRATQTWGVLPSAVGLCRPEDDLVYMMAYVRAEAAMQALEQQEMKAEAKRAKNRP